jgi:hypothetical protein
MAGDTSASERTSHMELIAAVCIAGPLGFLVSPRKRALAIYLGIWAIIFPIQSVIVGADDDFDILYWVFNALILCLGIGLNRGGAVLRARRRASSTPAPSARSTG